MNEIIGLAQETGMANELTQKLAELSGVIDIEKYNAEIAELLSPVTGADAVKKIEELTKPFSEHGEAALYVYLAAALKTREIYKQRNIPDTVFIETMKCFARFCDETHASKGYWGFDRGFWIWRQLSCTLFRLGCLEHEYLALADDITGADGEVYKKGTHVISVHIPSGADLSDEALKQSYAEAKAFFENGKAYITGFEDTPRVFFCSTWLLSPLLTALCKENSGIRRFAGMYNLYKKDEDSNMYISWLFGTPADTPPEDFCENSSLQRAVKAHVLNGGKIGTAAGLIKLTEIN